MTGSAVPVLDVWTKKKICERKKVYVRGEGFGERGYQNPTPTPRGWRMTGSAVPVLIVWRQKQISI